MGIKKEIMEIEESKRDLKESSLEDQILEALHNHIPWNKIASKFHVSTKTIQKIRVSEERKNQRQSADIETSQEGIIAAKVFELLSKGIKPLTIVIRLKLEPETVQKYREQFFDLEEHKNKVCKKCYNNGFSLGKWHGKQDVEMGIEERLKKSLAVTYPCSECGGNMVWYMDSAKDRDQIRGLLEKGGISSWGHNRCIGK